METPCIIPYAPRPLQWRFHQQRTRFCVLLCHRRFGKTVAAVNDLLRAALRTSRTDWRAAYAAPYLGQAKAVAWDYLRHFAGVIPGTRFHEGELRCDLPNGARIRLYGTDNAQALRGLYLDDLVLDEPADIPREVWSQILRPALARSCAPLWPTGRDGPCSAARPRAVTICCTMSGSWRAVWGRRRAGHAFASRPRRQATCRKPSWTPPAAA